MDEGTSHLDLAMEQRVTEAVKSLGLTRIIIAHRPETIASAPRRFLLASDGISECVPTTEPRRTVKRIGAAAPRAAASSPKKPKASHVIRDVASKPVVCGSSQPMTCAQS